jgi:hypothetical protein
MNLIAQPRMLQRTGHRPQLAHATPKLPLNKEVKAKPGIGVRIKFIMGLKFVIPREEMTN